MRAEFRNEITYMVLSAGSSDTGTHARHRCCDGVMNTVKMTYRYLSLTWLQYLWLPVE